MPLGGPATLEEFAEQLRLGFYVWSPDEDDDDRAWANNNPGNPTIITYNLDGLPSGDASTLAGLAFFTWQDVANIQFNFVSDPAVADIHFSSNAGENTACFSTEFFDALANQTWITDARINIQPGFGGGPGGGIFSFYFYTLVHEIGHALGLGHSGNYNGGNVNQFYNTNQTLFANDTWQYSIMSYNDQSQYDGGTATTPINPAMADIFAIQQKYGARSNANVGDTIYGSGATPGLIYNFALLGGPASFTIYDTSGNDALSGSTFSNNQTIDLRAGNWSSIGGRVHNVGIYLTTVIENAAGGSGHDTLIGNNVANRLTGNNGDDTLNGGLGADILDGGDGIDTVTYVNSASAVNAFLNAPQINNGGDAAGDSFNAIENLIGSAFGDILSGLTNSAGVMQGLGGNDYLSGGNANDILIGGLGDDFLNGFAGADELFGDVGDDTATYEFALAAVTSDLQSPGTNAGWATGDIYNSIENLGGTEFNDTLRGNAGVNSLAGWGGIDILDGRSGADTMFGGAGNDTYYVDNAGDQVVEASGGGTDHVRSSVGYSINGRSIERLTLTGSANINAIGTQYANTLTGNSGSNAIDGKGGADTMIGGAGNDTYYVDNAGDQAVEASGGGTDHVRSSVGYSINGRSIERLTLTGSANINAIGTQYANTLTGNSGSNAIDGKGGADTMIGGAGNDTYYVDNAGDQAVEASGGGTDQVRSSVGYSINGQSIERLTLTGSANINAIGTQYANTLTGNSGSNAIDGKGGADTMIGGAGNDTYYVDNAGDQAVEASGGGTDQVRSSVGYSINGQSIERLTLTGGANINAIGTQYANTLTGNSGNNLMDGWLGNDTLVGGGGSDTFRFGTALAGNVDTITDFSAANDKIRLDRSIFTAITTLGTLSSTAFVVGAAAADASDRIIYNAAARNLFYDSDGTGAAAAVQFAHFDAATAIGNTNFNVVA